MHISFRNVNLRIRFEEEADQRIPINQLTDEQKRYRDTVSIDKYMCKFSRNAVKCK
jgi:hypothetical protein